MYQWLDFKCNWVKINIINEIDSFVIELSFFKKI